MAFANGSTFILQRETDVVDTFENVGCQRSTAVTIATEQIDVTGKCNMPSRALIEGGVHTVDISASGVYDDSAGMVNFEADAQTGTITKYKLISDLGEELEGLFQISSFEKTGDHTDALQFSSSLVSAGPITYTAAS